MRDRVETYVISDLQQIRALADPLRQRILGAFVQEPRTTKQVAQLLGQPPTKLYHHVDLLERTGLIELVETRPKRGTLEKYFQAVASRFTVAQDSLAGEAGAALQDTLAEAFQAAQTAVRRALEEARDSLPQAFVALGSVTISPEDLPELRRRIMEAAAELSSASSSADMTSYRFLAAVYPSPEEKPEVRAR